MSMNEMNKKVAELRELRRMAEELNKEIEQIQSEIRSHMANNDLSELSGIDWKISYKAITSNKFDSAAFRKAMPEMYAAFTKAQTTRRLVVA